MVQGLAFLSKKSWHTKNLANQEKVWMAEQQKAAEDSKTKELARQIQQEREQDELDRISGKKSNRLDRGIDWMYQGGTGEAADEDAKKRAEEYLLGKEYVPEGGSNVGNFSAFDNTGISTVVGGAATSETHHGSEPAPSDTAASATTSAVAAPVYDDGPSVADRNESFRLRHEDPMFLVSQKRREKKDQVAKKKALYERVMGTEEENARRSHRSSRSDRESKRERKRQRKRERKRDRDHRGERKRHRRSRSRSRSRSRERSSRRSDRESQRHRDRDSYHRHRHRSRSPSEERSRYERYERHSYSSEDDTRNRSHYGDRDQRMDRPNDGYGLQGATKSSSRSDDLGPRRDLLNKKRQQQEAARRLAREKTSSRRHMTSEQRATALRDMQSNADQRDAALNRAVAQKPRFVVEEEVHPNGEASFLNDVAQRSTQVSMASRVSQNRHTNQNVNESFL